MFRRLRSDTRVETIEARYGINLNARSDMLLKTLLEQRGFESLSQLLRAYHGKLTSHAAKRKLFLSFHAEDYPQVQGFRLMAHNPFLELDFYDNSLRQPIRSENASYIRKALLSQITQCSVIVCLIGNGTAWREWVDWELSTAVSLKKGICGVRLKESRGRTPPLLTENGFPMARWDTHSIIAAIECAAARRS